MVKSAILNRRIGGRYAPMKCYIVSVGGSFTIKSLAVKPESSEDDFRTFHLLCITDG